MAIQEIRRSSSAQEYMVDELSAGTTLAKLVLKGIDFTRGRFRVAMPATVEQDRGLDFQQSLRLDRDEEITLARMIKCFIRDSKAAVLLQDTQKSISDPGLAHLNNKELMIPFEAEFYWTIAGRGLSEIPDTKMLEIVYSASYYPFSAFFYFDDVTIGRQSLQPDDLAHIVTNLVGIAVGVFDDRSFLIWWRDDLYPFPTVPAESA
jgi:hypothetical protein